MDALSTRQTLSMDSVNAVVMGSWGHVFLASLSRAQDRACRKFEPRSTPAPDGKKRRVLGGQGPVRDTQIGKRSNCLSLYGSGAAVRFKLKEPRSF